MDVARAVLADEALEDEVERFAGELAGEEQEDFGFAGREGEGRVGDEEGLGEEGEVGGEEGEGV